ncbi:sensor histidine kinase [Mucilaginibacter sp. FT3.2]|uniref:sensor histidine kinase n=1 Tax=Mucilaginibacter sp. FT3.2 TaxID=2723090 RepID=UPI0016096F26|nr:histidine kinase [Mucilaginibacter sp. FT3.2]MBB6234408.1 sensor histidine kinase YesM [Mucilaginibacter sp. FT3.2]
MQEKLPVKRLNRLSWLLSVIIGIIFYLIISRNSINEPVLPYTLLTMAGILLVGYADVGLMIIVAGRFPIRSKKFTLYRRLLTFPASILIYLAIWPVFACVAHKHWSFWDIQLFLAFVGSGVVINTMVMILHDSVLLYEHKLHSELELSRLKTANAEATNLLLKQQIQPHFLFNALNTLKALYHKDLPTADTYLVHMANFLRASIYHHTSNVAKLEDEVSLLLDYLEMQRIRFGSALDCIITLPEETLKTYYLPSFSLQPLLENAIKHNNFTREEPLTVTISQHDDWLVISNNRQKKKIKVASTNYGLANLAERYRLWSGDDILIREEDNSFSVSIKLLKDEHRNY